MTSSEGTKGDGERQAASRGAATADQAFAGRLVRHMEGAALQAARFIQGHAGDLASLTWESKAPTDFASEVDLGAEQRIRALLESGLAGDARSVRVVGEEFSPDATIAGEGVVFVVDPLDGTTNFLHGFPWYAVSIGALVDGVLTAGVVINAATGETFSATLGGGAYRNGARISVSHNADPQRALIGTGFPFRNVERLELYQRQFAALAGRTAGMRRAGAAALDLCDVACGRFDAFWELNLMPWDVAAGILVIREAGGVVTDLAGAEARVAEGPLVAGSAAMHPWFLATLQGEGSL